jgi:uncharacterized membrane protein SirB2
MTELSLVRLLHLGGFALWLAGLCALALLLHAGARHRAAGILADIGATLAIVSGLYNAIQRKLFAMPWMHVKLTLVLALIVLHVVLRVRTRKEKRSGAMELLLASIAVAIIVMAVAVFQPFRS